MKEKTKLNELREIEKLSQMIRDRRSYKVHQANILAYAFGDLTKLEQLVLDYCFTFIKKDDKKDGDRYYETNYREVIDALGLSTSGFNYGNIASVFQNLKDKTNIWLPVEEIDIHGKKHLAFDYVSLFEKIRFLDNGNVGFFFSSAIAPYAFELTKHFYEIEFSQIATLKSKYTIALLKLWSSEDYGRQKKTVIEGTLDQWRTWMLGKRVAEDPEQAAKWNAGRLKQRVLNVAAAELESKAGCVIEIIAIKKGRKHIGYRLEITRWIPKANIKKEQSDEEIQDLIVTYSLENEITLKESASKLFATGIIDEIPDKFR